MSVAQQLAQQQQQQYSSVGGYVGGPEEAPPIASATLPFLVCITKSHGAASTPWICEWSYVQRKEGWQVCHMKKNCNMHIVHLLSKRQL